MNCFAIFCSNHNIMYCISFHVFNQTCIQEHIVFTNGNCINSVLTRTRIFSQAGFLNHTTFSGHHNKSAVYIFIIFQVFCPDVCFNFIVGFNIDKVLNCTSLRCFSSFRQFIHFQPETFSFRGKEN